MNNKVITKCFKLGTAVTQIVWRFQYGSLGLGFDSHIKTKCFKLPYAVDIKLTFAIN